MSAAPGAMGGNIMSATASAATDMSITPVTDALGAEVIRGEIGGKVMVAPQS